MGFARVLARTVALPGIAAKEPGGQAIKVAVNRLIPATSLEMSEEQYDESCDPTDEAPPT